MTKKLPSDYVDKLMTGVLVRIASGGQPYSRSNSDGVAMYYLQQWGFVRTKNRSNKWEVTCAGYQHLKSEYPHHQNTADMEELAKKLKKLTVRMQQIGYHAAAAVYEVANMKDAFAMLEKRINDIGDNHIEEDAKRAGFEYPAPKAPD